jgi:hypothetical protein
VSFGRIVAGCPTRQVIPSASINRTNQPIEPLAAMPTAGGPTYPEIPGSDPAPPPPVLLEDRTPAAPPSFNGIWELARALNRADREAIAIAAADGPAAIAVHELEVRKLVGTFWFRSVFPQFSPSWRERLLDVLTAAVIVPNRMIRMGWQIAPLKDLNYEQIKELGDKQLMQTEGGADVRLLLAIGGLWGPSAFARVRFGQLVQAGESSRLATLLSGLRP